MKNTLKKFTSRKFIVSMISAVAGLVTMIFGHGEAVQAVAGALMVIVPTIVYCIMEGKIDVAQAKTITDAAVEAAEKLGQDEVADKIEQAGEIVETVLDGLADVTETETN